MRLFVVVSAGEFFLLLLFPLIFGSFEVLHLNRCVFGVFVFLFVFESFQIFFLDIFQNVMGELRSVIAFSERDVDTFAQCSFV